ncbi:MAG: heme-binding protein [Rhodospirillales bacterium]|nr:heme-binding protein [Rhodospirillales bacterium]
MRLKTNLALEKAATIVDEALRLARQENMLPQTVVVLDCGGKIIAVKSEDGSGLVRFGIAMGKAWGALGMGISSRLINERLGGRPAFLGAVAAVSEGKFVPVAGGVLIDDADGFTIGAVGISGDTSEKDEYCAISAIIAAGFRPEPAAADPEWQNSSLSGPKK